MSWQPINRGMFVRWLVFLSVLLLQTANGLSLLTQINGTIYDTDVLTWSIVADTTGNASIYSNVQGVVSSMTINQLGINTFPNFSLIQAGHEIEITLGLESLNLSVLVVPKTLKIGNLHSRGPDDAMTLAVAYYEFYNRINRTILPNIDVQLITVPAGCNLQLGTINYFNLAVNEKVEAVIGPDCSSLAKVIGVDSGAFNIPLVSYSAGNVDLSNKAIYPYFFRTCGTSAYESLTFISAAMQFGWSNLVAISIDAYPLPQPFYTAASANNITIEFNIILTNGFTSATTQLGYVKESGYKVIIAYMYDGINNQNDLSNLLSQADEMGLMDPSYVWLIANSGIYTFNELTDPEIQQKYSGFLLASMVNYKGNLPLRAELVNIWNNVNHSLIDPQNQVVGNTYPAFEDSNTVYDLGVNTLQAYDVDALYLILHALHSIVYEQKVPITGHLLKTTMQSTVFEGVSGIVKLNANQDGYYVPLLAKLDYPGGNYNLTNVGMGVCNFTTWETNYVEFQSFSWRTGGTNVPKAFNCINDCGNGTCVAPNVCKCQNGYLNSGTQNCNIPVCNVPCVNGVCVSPDVCKCKRNWIGPTCSVHDLPIYFASFEDPALAFLETFNILAMVFTLLAIYINVTHASKPEIRMENIPISVACHIGNIFLSISGILRLYSSISECIASRIFLHLGCSIVISSLALKNYKILGVFSNQKMKTNGLLFLMLLRFIFVECLLLLLLFLLDTPTIISVDNSIDSYFSSTCTQGASAVGTTILALLGIHKLLQFSFVLWVDFQSSALPRDFNQAGKAVRCCTPIIFAGILYILSESIQMPGGERTRAIYYVLMCTYLTFSTTIQSFGKNVKVLLRLQQTIKSTTPSVGKQHNRPQNQSPMSNLYNFTMPSFHKLPGLFSRWMPKTAVLDGKFMFALVSNDIGNSSNMVFIFGANQKPDVDISPIRNVIGEEFDCLVQVNSLSGYHQIILSGSRESLEEWVRVLQQMLGVQNNVAPNHMATKTLL